MRTLVLRPQALFNRQERGAQPKEGARKKPDVQYGRDWYAATREAAQPRRSVREEMEYRRQANRAANNGRERKDLYTDNWDGSEYKGSSVNVLTVIGAISILAPLIGLIFALQTYGTLWG